MIMEKPAHELGSIKNDMSKLVFTKTALNGTIGMGMTCPDMEKAVGHLANSSFHKPMTTHHGHQVWMDVSHGHAEDLAIDIKCVRGGSGAFDTSVQGEAAMTTLAEVRIHPETG